MPENAPLLVLGGLLVFVLLLSRYVRASRFPRNLPLPPGPKRLPVLGNALNMPLSKQWLTFQRWAEEYGEIIYFDLLGQPVVLLNSAKATSDLLDKRSAIYSDRFKSTVVPMIGWDWNVALMGYGPKWRQTRRAFHEHFHQGVVHRYQPNQLAGARKYITRLLANPDNFAQDLRYDLGSTILEVSYGIKAQDHDDKYIAIGERAVEGPTEALVLGALWIEFIPILRHLPSWWPGASYQRKAIQWREEAMALKYKPFEKAMSDFRDGEGVWSLATDLMDQDGSDGDQPSSKEEIAQNVAAVTYGAGADTSFSTIQTFILAMALYPEVQRKAQAELDVVVGPFRLPEFEDQKKLPYIHAIVKECLRWQNVFPLGLPHRLMEDEEYNGYHLPKGSIVLGNIWTISQNPDTFPNPEVFDPDRYFKDGTWNTSVLDPAVFAFGFGRRACPGRHFTIASIFIYAATILHVYNIGHKRDANGKPVEIKADMTPGVVSGPAKFECDISPRSVNARTMIRSL